MTVYGIKQFYDHEADAREKRKKQNLLFQNLFGTFLEACKLINSPFDVQYDIVSDNLRQSVFPFWKCRQYSKI